MSVANTQAARTILDNLLKSKTELKNLRTEINGLNTDVSRLSTTLTQLARGDPTGLIIQLAQMGPVGLKLAIGVATVAVAYGIYSKLTEEKPTELYFWRYPQ